MLKEVEKEEIISFVVIIFIIGGILIWGGGRLPAPLATSLLEPTIKFYDLL